jgi:hypothetical protein
MTKFSLLTLAALLHLSTYAQDLTGLWQFTKVEVGNKNMTPIAKWTKISKDGTYTSGNGWMQNSVGHWTFDEKKNSFLPANTNGIADEFGAFAVEHTDNEHMIWTRTEEGMTVTVYLERIKELPIGPMDQVQGLWKFENVTENSDQPSQHLLEGSLGTIHIRWDRKFTLRNESVGRTTGIWTMHGHRPELTLLYDNDEISRESYNILFEDDMMYWEEVNNKRKISFVRIQEYPQ